jgi:hypothetical protein
LHEGDINGDGWVDAADAGIAFEYWTVAEIEALNIPEPSSALLITGAIWAPGIKTRWNVRG